jgi:hypothetical protein
MSNLDTTPAEIACAPSHGAGVEVLHPRDLPLGGPRAIHVRRTLPQRQRSLVGAWCFADHYGPHDVRGSHGMDVAPHPHTGLQTVSWLFSDEVEHRDSAGVHAVVRPGELNLILPGPASYRRLWEAHDERFGAVDGYPGTPDRLPAPPLPATRLRPRPASRREESH